ncbi:MAG TPA: hypothetical protein VK694_03390 [Verrucomicrobiae bacterium]|nr:hypothetical protein [Verrucomicrobiae bacterium]
MTHKLKIRVPAEHRTAFSGTNGSSFTFDEAAHPEKGIHGVAMSSNAMAPADQDRVLWVNQEQFEALSRYVLAHPQLPQAGTYSVRGTDLVLTISDDQILFIHGDGTTVYDPDLSAWSGMVQHFRDGRRPGQPVTDGPILAVA